MEFLYYKPISMVNDIYKLWKISENQTAFITGQQIVDGFMMTNEVIHNLKKSGSTCMIFKVDFHKTFDIILCEFIDEKMGYMGFGKKIKIINS